MSPAFSSESARSADASTAALADPSAGEIREALSRVLASRVFESAGRARALLKFVVGQTLSGRGDRLKGYTIAVGALGRRHDFDAQSDSFVRVEAGRLRRRLVEYYSDEGRHDRVRIELRRGAYRPVFSYATTDNAMGRVGGVDTAGKARQRALLIGTNIAWLVALVLTWIDDWHTRLDAAPTPLLSENRIDERATTTFTARMVVLPLAAVGGPPEEASFESLHTRFVAACALSGCDGENAPVSIHWVEVSSGTEAWARVFDEQLHGLAAAVPQERMENEVVAELPSPYRPSRHEIGRTANSSAGAEPADTPPLDKHSSGSPATSR
jgi:hypothetical protein